jgi:spore maturation protein A
MNGIFSVIIILSVTVLLFTSPESAMSAMLSGGERAIELSLTMTAVYALWLGLLRLAESCGVTSGLSSLLRRPVRLIFGKTNKRAEELIAMNLSANLLGMGGVATPMGISAAEELDKQGNTYAMGMLLVLAATGIQLLPTSVIALRAEMGSTSPSDIILPTLAVTAITAILSALIFHLLARRKRR